MGRKRLSSALWFCLLLCFSMTASAQEDKAQKLFEEAELYFKASRYDKAAELYTEAFVASQIPDLLFNVAQCYRNTKKYEDTLKTLKQYMLLVSSGTDDLLLENLPGLKKIQALLSILEAESDFPKKNSSVKTLLKEDKELSERLISKIAALPKPSALSLSGTVDAVVFLDDIKLEGKTPLDILKAKKGSHKLSVTKEGYFPWSKTFEVTGDGKAVSFLVELVPVVLVVQGTPEADVLLNGEIKGKIPFRLEGLKQGAYKVSVRLAGHKSWASDVILPGNGQEPVTLTAELTPLVLKVDGSPTAELSIDGDYQGKLPVSIEKITVGKHKLTVKEAGFEEWSTDITISNEQTLYEQRVEMKALVIKKGGDKVAGPADDSAGSTSAAPFALYAVSAVAVGGGVAALIGSMKAKNDAITLLDLNQPSLLDLVVTLDAQAKQLSAASIGAFVVAAGAGVGGVLLSKKSKTKTALHLSITPTSVALSGGF